jgi:hypothetical protein
VNGFFRVASAGILLLLAACGETTPTQSEARRTGTRPASPAPAKAPVPPRPSISILTPADGRTVHATAVTVSVAVNDFNIVEQRVRPPFPRPVAGKGHVHFYLDAKTIPTTHSPPTTGAYRSISGTTYTWTGLGSGRHALAVQLVGKDHVPLSPQAKDEVTVTVE